jgi:hypothetical protein
MPLSPANLPKSRYALEVDGLLKTEFLCKESAEIGAAELKQRFPAVQIKIFDTVTKTRHEIQLA